MRSGARYVERALRGRRWRGPVTSGVDHQRAVSLFLPGLSAHTHVELPFYSKFLLIAAYLASYNPARTDKRFFLKV